MNTMNTNELFERAFAAYEHGVDAETHDLNLADYWYQVMTDYILMYHAALISEVNE